MKLWKPIIYININAKCVYYYKNTKMRSTLKPIHTLPTYTIIFGNILTTMALWWCCTSDRKVRGNSQTYRGGRYLTVASGNGKTEKPFRHTNCVWDELDENKTHEIQRRRTARSGDGELSLARTYCGSRCDSKFRAVRTDAAVFIPFSAVRPPTPPLVRYLRIIVRSQDFAGYVVQLWLDPTRRKISPQQQVSLVHNNII